jgi:hypothetical protein
VVAGATSALEKLRTGQTEERLAMEAHLQQTIWTSINAATREVEGKLGGIAEGAAERAGQKVAAQLNEQEQSWRERASAVQDSLRNLVSQIEAGVQRAESALQSLQAAAEQAEAYGVRLQKGAPTSEAAGMAERIQKSIAEARVAFRQSLAEVSKVLENSLQANKFTANPGEERGRT